MLRPGSKLSRHRCAARQGCCGNAPNGEHACSHSGGVVLGSEQEQRPEARRDPDGMARQRVPEPGCRLVRRYRLNEDCGPQAWKQPTLPSPDPEAPMTAITTVVRSVAYVAETARCRLTLMLARSRSAAPPAGSGGTAIRAPG